MYENALFDGLSPPLPDMELLLRRDEIAKTSVRSRCLWAELA